MSHEPKPHTTYMTVTEWEAIRLATNAAASHRPFDPEAEGVGHDAFNRGRQLFGLLGHRDTLVVVWDEEEREERRRQEREA